MLRRGIHRWVVRAWRRAGCVGAGLAIALFAILPLLQGYCLMQPRPSEDAVAHSCCTGGIAATPPSCCDVSPDQDEAVLVGKLVVLPVAPAAALESIPLTARAIAPVAKLTAPLLHGPPPPLRI